MYRLLLGLALGASLALCGCKTTDFTEREALSDRAMQFDSDGGLQYFRGKLEAAREGGLGGFGSGTAGGCGCQ